MKYIAKYGLQKTGLEEALRDHDEEYYRTPHGRINGEWAKLHTHQDGRVTAGYIKSYEEYNPQKYLPEVEFAKKIFEELEFSKDSYLELHAGYTAYVHNNVLVAESYIACSGNFVGIFHEDDISILYVNSARHGIPALARQFYGVEPKEVFLYDSWRKDTSWWECDLAPTPPQD